ncbi:MAG TPA: type I-MYXAN CRISPR-associated protein Cas6/Cmx6 [Acidobacteriota bacterium]|nr:type I-MYXAN CRISPR-associated protein Cas6/Cmx6 [Acidobacteriota bacterium]
MLVDVCFRLVGSEIPIDHGYALYSCVSRLIPFLHASDSIGIHPISGIPSGKGRLLLTDLSRVSLRIPVESFREVLPLAGQNIEIVVAGQRFQFRTGIPEVYQLKPVTSVWSRTVVIKLSESEKQKVTPTREMFLESLKKQIESLGVKGTVKIESSLDSQGREAGRKILNIKGKLVVGYAVTISDLLEEESIQLQERGLGGRRKMGCGVFVPAGEKP